MLRSLLLFVILSHIIWEGNAYLAKLNTQSHSLTGVPWFIFNDPVITICGKCYDYGNNFKFDVCPQGTEQYKCCYEQRQHCCRSGGETLIMVNSADLSWGCCTCSCPEGKVYDRTENSDDQYGRAQCIPCPAGTHFDSGKCVCDNGRTQDPNNPFVCTCPEGEYVMADGSCGKCSSDKKYNPTTRACDCHAGLLNPETGVCELCPEGKTRALGGACIDTPWSTSTGALRCTGSWCSGYKQAANDFLTQKGNPWLYQKEFIPTMIGDCIAQDSQMSHIPVLVFPSPGKKAQLMCSVLDIWLTRDLPFPIAAYCHPYHFDNTLGDDFENLDEVCHGKGRRLFFLELSNSLKTIANFPYYEAIQSSSITQPAFSCLCDPGSSGEFCQFPCGPQCALSSSIGTTESLCDRASKPDSPFCCGTKSVDGLYVGIAPDGRHFALDCSFQFSRMQCPPDDPGPVSQAPTSTITSSTSTPTTSTVTSSTRMTTTTKTPKFTTIASSTTAMPSTTTTSTTTPTMHNATISDSISTSSSFTSEHKKALLITGSVIASLVFVSFCCFVIRRKSRRYGFEHVPLTRVQ